MNTWQGIGRLTKAPDIRQGQTETANFTLAIDRPARGGEKQTDFPKVVCFGKTAEVVGQYCHKGQLVAVEGRIQTGSYTNRDGQKVYTTDVVAIRVEILEWNNSKEPQYGNKDYGVDEPRDYGQRGFGQ